MNNDPVAILKRLAAALMVGVCGGLFGGMLFGLATFWMYALGGIIGLPLGFCCGFALGWVTPLRDAVIFCFGTFGILSSLNWIRFATDSRGPEIMLLVVPIILIVGGFCWWAHLRLSPFVRYCLALGSIAAFLINFSLVFAIRS